MASYPSGLFACYGHPLWRIFPFMAIIPLQSPTWSYDTDLQVLTATFTESAPADAADPASWSPPRAYNVNIPLPKTRIQVKDLTGSGGFVPIGTAPV